MGGIKSDMGDISLFVNRYVHSINTVCGKNSVMVNNRYIRTGINMGFYYVCHIYICKNISGTKHNIITFASVYKVCSGI